MATQESGPQSLIFDFHGFDEDDSIDTEMSKAYKELMDSLQGMSEIDIHNHLQASASGSTTKHERIINGLLYGILTYNSNSAAISATAGTATVPASSSTTTPVQSNEFSPTDLFRHMNFVARDSLAHAVKQTRHFCALQHFHRIRPQVREQLLWLVGKLTEIRVHAVDQLYMLLLKQIRGGDVSHSNVQHAEAMLRLLQAHLQPWVYSMPTLIACACFTYLRLMLDHGRMLALRQHEAAFCAKLLRDRFRDCSDVGRDLVRALQDVARIKEIEEIWVDLLHSPEKLNPQLEGVHQLMAMPSKDIYLGNRLTFDMEHKLLHILKYINLGQHNRNLQWFTERYLSAPESDALYCDVIRYICGVYHPTNAVLASSIVPRYVLIGSLVRNIKSNVAAANVKLALFYDWLSYDPAKDSIMNIEPAMLLMERSVERYPYLTAILLEFLHFTVENYHPPLRDYIHKHVGMAAQAIVEKGVIRSFRFIYRSPSLDDYPPVREYMLSMFPAQLGDIIESASGSSMGGNTSMEGMDENNVSLRPINDNEMGESVDEFESSPPHSGFVAQGIAGQDREDDDDEQDRKGRKSRNASRESSREPMPVDELVVKMDEDETMEDEVMESSAVEPPSSVPPPSSKAQPNASVLADWSFTDDTTSTIGSAKGSDSTGTNTATPIPGASLWIFGSSLQEFKKAYESDPEAPGTAKMFQHIWEVYGDVAGAGVEGSDIAQEIGQETCAFAQKAEIPESYIQPSDDTTGQDQQHAGVMEPLMTCLWKITERDGKEGALRVAQMFLKTEVTVDPESRLLGMWYLLGLLRGQGQRGARSNISLEQILQLYGSYIKASVRQDQVDKIEQGNEDDSNDSLRLGQDYLLKDLQSLQDRQPVAFDTVLPLVLRYLPEFIPRTEAFLKLALIMATPAQIYRLSRGLVKGDFCLLSIPVASSPTVKEEKVEEEEKKKVKTARVTRKKSGSQEKLDEMAATTSRQSLSRIAPQTLEVVEQTLDWDTYEQLGLWQLILSELGGVSDAVAMLLSASWVPKMTMATRAEALNGLLNLVRSLTFTPPTAQLGRAIVWIASQTTVISDEMKEFCEDRIAQWARDYPDHVAAILLSLSDKNAAPVESLGGMTVSADGDLEMEDTTIVKPGSNKVSAKNARTKNGAVVTKTPAKLTAQQRKEQANQLRAALSLVRAWWNRIGLSPSSSASVSTSTSTSISTSTSTSLDSSLSISTAKLLFSRIWSPQVKTQVQEALLETFGASEKNSWPKQWWSQYEDDSKRRRRGGGGRKDTRSNNDDDDDDEEEEDEEEEENERSQDEEEGENGGSRSNDDQNDEEEEDEDEDDHRRKKNDVNRNEDSEEEQNGDSERKNKEKKRFGGAASATAGSAGSSRRNSPKVNSGTSSSSSAFSNNHNGGGRKGSVAGSAAAGVLNSRSRGKNSPAPSTAKKVSTTTTKRGATSRKRKISDDDDDEDEDEEVDEDEVQDDDEEEEEEDAEEEEEVGNEEDDDEEQEGGRNSRSKKGAAKRTTKKPARATATKAKTRVSTRSKAKPTSTRNGRAKQAKTEEDDEEDEDEDEEQVEGQEEDEDDEEMKDDDDDNEDENEKEVQDRDEGEQDKGDDDEEEEEEEDEEMDNGKLPIYSQRRAAASANSKLMTKSSPTSSNSSTSSSSGGAKSKAAAAKRRGKRRIPSEDDSDE